MSNKSLLIAAFNSGSSVPMRRLSNLTDARITLTWPEDVEGVPQHMRGKTATYDSSEHAYQALRSLNAQTARAFESGGVVSMEIFRAFPVCKGKNEKYTIINMYVKKESYWGARGCRGIAAKMVGYLPPPVAKAALSLDLATHEARSGGLDAELPIWRPILVAKFMQNRDIGRELMKTAPALLVETGRFRKPNQYWSAFVVKEGKSNKLIGQNMTGRLLTAIRDEHRDAFL